MKPIVCTYWWSKKNAINNNTNYDFDKQAYCEPKTYSQLVDDISNDCKRLNLPFYAKRIPCDNYQKNINYKPQFIKHCLRKWKRPVVYIDSDMRIVRYPLLFDNLSNTDFMALNWRNDGTFETSGGIFYFNNTLPAKRLLDCWISELAKNQGKADDRVLAMVIAKHNVINWCKCTWLPKSYLHFPAYSSTKTNRVIISHPYKSTDEEDAYRMGSSKNRIPRNYNKVVRTKT